MRKSNLNICAATIEAEALDKIRAYVNDSEKVEIGGPMVGFLNLDNEVVIVDVEGPGENGVCMPCYVIIDGDHSKNFCDKAYSESNGVIDYVGDWHCHHSRCLAPSDADILAMEIMAETPGITSSPVSLIYSSELDSYKIYGWSK